MQSLLTDGANYMHTQRAHLRLSLHGTRTQLIDEVASLAHRVLERELLVAESLAWLQWCETELCPATSTSDLHRILGTTLSQPRDAPDLVALLASRFAEHSAQFQLPEPHMVAERQALRTASLSLLAGLAADSDAADATDAAELALSKFSLREKEVAQVGALLVRRAHLQAALAALPADAAKTREGLLATATGFVERLCAREARLAALEAERCVLESSMRKLSAPCTLCTEGVHRGSVV